MTIYDLLWKGSEDKDKARWEKVGILMEKDNGKKSVKIDLVPVGQWDGWRSYRKGEPKRNAEKSRRSAANPNHFKNHRASLSLSLKEQQQARARPTGLLPANWT